MEIRINWKDISTYFLHKAHNESVNHKWKNQHHCMWSHTNQNLVLLKQVFGVQLLISFEHQKLETASQIHSSWFQVSKIKQFRMKNIWKHEIWKEELELFDFTRAFLSNPISPTMEEGYVSNKLFSLCSQLISTVGLKCDDKRCANQGWTQF